MTTSTSLAPGWYADPTGSSGQRFWDGTSWTDQVAPGPVSTELEARTPARHRAPSGRAVPMWLFVMLGAVVAAIVAVVIWHATSSSSGVDPAAQAQVDSDARAAVSTVAQCYIDNDNTYPAAATGTDGVIAFRCGGTSESSPLSAGDSARFVPSGDHYVLTVDGPGGAVASFDSRAGQIKER